jgi:hypothetical protein
MPLGTWSLTGVRSSASPEPSAPFTSADRRVLPCRANGNEWEAMWMTITDGGAVPTMVNPWLTLGDAPPFIAEVDRVILDDEHQTKYGLRCEVLPHAWLGNPLTARVLILQLNPGFGDADVINEERNPHYRPLIRESLALRESTTFWALDPRLADTGAGQWWRPRLRPLIAELNEERVRERVAVVEYFPYHSVGYLWPPRLPSQDFGFSVVREAVSNGAVILVMRQWESWRAAVPQLIPYDKTFRNQHPRQAAISRSNLGNETFEAMLTALA